MPRFASEIREAQQARAHHSVEAAEHASLPMIESVDQSATSAVAGPVPAPDAGETCEPMNWSYEADDDRAAEAEFEGAQSQTNRTSEPELVPVAASVFDDEFFRSPSVRLRPSVEPDASDPNLAEYDLCDDCCVDGPIQHSRPSVPEYDPEEPAHEVRLFAGASATHAEPAETDELDIPAFLRRSQ
jgi:cell division protein FtsZ